MSKQTIHVDLLRIISKYLTKDEQLEYLITNKANYRLIKLWYEINWFDINKLNDKWKSFVTKINNIYDLDQLNGINRLKSLALGWVFNQQIDNLPQSLTSLTLGLGFNQPLSKDNLPQSLTSLTFYCNSYFNQPIDKLPQSLTSLDLGRNFNQPIDNLPQSLTSLTLKVSFNQPIDNLPQSLTSLDLGNLFNQPIHNLPQSLTSLTLSLNFNLPILNLPQSLKKLKIYEKQLVLIKCPLPPNCKIEF